MIAIFVLISFSIFFVCYCAVDYCAGDMSVFEHTLMLLNIIVYFLLTLK